MLAYKHLNEPMWLNYSNCCLHSFEMSSTSNFHHWYAVDFDLKPWQSFVKSARFVVDPFDLRIVEVVRFMMIGLWITVLISATRADFVRAHHHPFSAFSCTHAIASFSSLRITPEITLADQPCPPEYLKQLPAAGSSYAHWLDHCQCCCFDLGHLMKLLDCYQRRP